MNVVPGIIVRKYQPSDRDRVVDLFRAGMMEYAHQGPRQSWACYVQRAIDSDLANIEQVYDIGKDENSSHIGCFWVADREGDVIGTVAVQALTDQPGVAELRRMSIARNARRLGLAKRLVETLEEWCRLHDFSRIMLSTRESMTPAVLLYESLGYCRTQSETWVVHDQNGIDVAFQKPTEDTGLPISDPLEFRIVYFEKALSF